MHAETETKFKAVCKANGKLKKYLEGIASGEATERATLEPMQVDAEAMSSNFDTIKKMIGAMQATVVRMEAC